MKSIGALLSLSAKKPWGVVEYESLGNWKLISNGKVAGRTFNSRTIIIFDEKDKGYIFTWDSGIQRINLLGHKIRNVSPAPVGLHIEDDYVTAEWEAGKIYELHL
ncbi:MAG TPA: hypothetical protein GXX20_05115 [Clostridiaceae bacterium]|nr:hypothetical protein [Clostridiaceae bacterium]